MENEEENNMEIGDLTDIKAKELVDLSEFEGEKKKINNVEILDVKSHYINGEFHQNDTIDMKAVRISTEPVNKDEKDFSPSEIFNLQKDEKGNWGISTSPKAKLRILMNKYKVKKVEDLMGKEVILRIRKSGFLGFFCWTHFFIMNPIGIGDLINIERGGHYVPHKLSVGINAIINQLLINTERIKQYKMKETQLNLKCFNELWW